MTTCSSVPAWRIPWTEEPGGVQSMGVTKSRTQLKRLSIHTRPPLQCRALLKTAHLVYPNQTETVVT